MGFIYRLDFASGKSYVGITTKSVPKRYREHQLCAANPKKKALIYSAWRKHGAPVIAMISEIDNDLLLAAEIAMIADLNTLDPGGYNTTTGGVASPMHSRLVVAKVLASRAGTKRAPVSEESRAKMSAVKLGKKMSPEAKAKLSAAKKGQPSKLKGRKLPPEIGAAISARQKGISVPEERRIRISATLTGKVQSIETVAKRVLAVKATWAAKRLKINGDTLPLLL